MYNFYPYPNPCSFTSWVYIYEYKLCEYSMSYYLWKNVENEPTSNNIIEFTEDAFMYEKKHVNPLLEPKLSTI